ncbi:hypothetical protein HKD37_03G006697 [Glycine soja]
MKVASDVLAVELLQKVHDLLLLGSWEKHVLVERKTVLTSATSLKVDIQRRCLPQQRLRMSTFKDDVEVSTVFECQLTKTVLILTTY